MTEKYQLLPPLSAEEYERLKADIALRGVMVPVEIDENGNILDGHNRAQIAGELGIDYPTVVRRGLPEHEKRLHAVTLNLARRHLTDGQKTLIGRTIEPDVAERARLRMAAGGGDKKSATAKSGMDICPEPIQQATTRDEVAAEVGIGSGRTYERNKQVIQEAEELAVDSIEIADALESLEAGDIDIPQLKKAMKPHVSHNSGENEWYTPPVFLEAARKTLGQIDLDPASNDIAQENVKAKQYFTIDDNGLDQNWVGRVWLNPPYSNPEIKQFCEKLIYEIEVGNTTDAIILVNNATETQWGQLLLRNADAVCFPAGRIKYFDQTNQPRMTPLQGQMFVYFGTDSEAFRSNFHTFGTVL